MIASSQSTTENYRKLALVLGKKYFRSTIESPFDMIRVADKGINSNVVTNFRKYFNLPRESTSTILNISEPTLYRWMKGNKSLDKIATIKLLEVAYLFLYGTDVFESNEGFLQWLKMPNKSFGGLKPMQLVELPEGVSKIKDELGRIEHGIFG